MWYLISAITGAALWHVVLGIWDCAAADQHQEDVLHAYAHGLMDCSNVRIEGYGPIDPETARELAEDWLREQSMAEVAV